ncbi:MAG TPA: DUF5906 domain-containing protein, partial [Rhizobium sp.]|nr:DUF5906 domain-containing protein [Rhizobium sp.]
MAKGRTPYLEKYGPLALENGYEIIPIKPGTKRPPFDKWEEIRANQSKLDRWLDHGRGDHGVGILARKTPMVDIDCRDEKIVRKMIDFTQDLLGDTLQRVGFAPKTGLLYRTNKPFPKVNSATFVDPDDDSDKPATHKLEVLGDGQQFVAFAVHPDTGKPYRWIEKEGPHNLAWSELPVISRTEALEIAAEFERLMREAGYVEKRKSRLDRERASAGEIDDDDEFVTDAARVDITTQELSLKLALVPGADDYDTWRDVGMALYHQYEGADEGLILWHEWSAQASNYDQDVLDDKWPTFDIEGKGRAPVTARLILKLANEEERRIAGEQAEDTREEIRKAKTIEALKEAAEKVKRIAFEPLIREGIVDLVKRRYKDISGNALSTGMARQLTRYENPENRRKPKWLEGFVYVERDKVFYHIENRMELDAEAFNAKHNRFMMTQKDRLEGRSAPEHTASQAALNLWEIETVYRRMYMPHEDRYFVYNGQRFVNFYTEIGVPDVPESLSSDEKAAIKRVKAHFAHLFASERDRKLLLDWLAYTVQERRRISWAPLIQGTQGDGKTFFARMLKVVLGWENVAIVPGEALEEKYNHWMEGALLVFFEEVRLHGANRYEAINRMKPWITNDNITIRAMHRGSYEVVNTASIIAASNHKDAIPAGQQDTRYFPMFSRWQTKERLDAFERENPGYYTDLYGALEYGGALRRWLLNHEISDEFNAAARAPKSSNRAEMLALSASDEEEAFNEALAESDNRGFSKMILDSTLLDDELETRGCDA